MHICKIFILDLVKTCCQYLSIVDNVKSASMIIFDNISLHFSLNLGLC